MYSAIFSIYFVLTLLKIMLYTYWLRIFSSLHFSHNNKKKQKTI